jgi:hypothetical protein
MKDNLLPEFAALLSACALKVVPETAKFYPVERIRSIEYLAREALGTDATDSGFDDAL